MRQMGAITAAQEQEAAASGLGLERSTYYVKRRENYFFDYVRKELVRVYGEETVKRGGLRVYTTIDLKKQKFARAAIAKNLSAPGSPSSALVSMDPKTGYIKAMASSSNYGDSKFNLAAQGKRQPGSAFKVFTLMAALRRGVNPQSTTYVSRSPTLVKDPLCPGYEVNTYSRRGAGSMNLVQATLASDNSVYIQLALDIGPAEVKKTAQDLGIRSKLEGYCAETLGGLTDGVSPLEMANAYATILSGGYRNRPTAITRVAFPDGRVEKGKKLPSRFRIKRTKAFDSAATYEAVKILEQNISKPGTGGRANIGCPAGGKTGTTDKNTDAWFVGFTPRLSTAVWVGYPKERIQMNGLFGGMNVDGGTFPAQIWGDYMRVAKGSYCGPFKKPNSTFQSSPFFGTRSKTGTTGGSTTDAQGNPVTPAPSTGGGTAPEQNYNPDLYESPPQEAPEPVEPEPDSGGRGNSPKADVESAPSGGAAPDGE
jgi:penicillin-binding protein 1A